MAEDGISFKTPIVKEIITNRKVQPLKNNTPIPTREDPSSVIPQHSNGDGGHTRRLVRQIQAVSETHRRFREPPAAKMAITTPRTSKGAAAQRPNSSASVTFLNPLPSEEANERRYRNGFSTTGGYQNGGGGVGPNYNNGKQHATRLVPKITRSYQSSRSVERYHYRD